MKKFGVLIDDLDEALAKLASVRDGLKQMQAESEAVEKARDSLRGRRRPKKDTEPR